MSKLTWKVLYYNTNVKKIEYYDIFENERWVRIARETIDLASCFEDWKESFRKELMYHFWCRSEYEIIVTSWPPCISIEQVARMNEDIKNWVKDYGKTPKFVNINLPVAEKIDIYSQIMANWEPFTYYVWNFIYKEEDK